MEFNNKKSKKIIAIVLAATMIVPTTGCGLNYGESEKVSKEQYVSEKGNNTESFEENETTKDEKDSENLDYDIVQTDESDELTNQQRNAINMLNYITVLTQEINDSKDSRIYLDNAYSSLINNINPNVVDINTENEINDILDSLEAYRMIDVKRERIKYLYERNEANIMREAIPSPLSVLSLAQSGNVLKSAVSAVYMSIDSVKNYNDSKDENELKYIQDDWELDDEEEENVHNSRKKAFSYMIDVVRENSLPEGYALNENAVSEFVKWKNEDNLTSKIQWFEDHKNTYEKFGTYWLELASDYYDNDEYKKCLNSVIEYEKILNGIFRKDYDYAKIAPKIIISSRQTMNDEDYIKTADKYIEIILKNTDDSDWVLRYFAAQTYLDLYGKTGEKQYLKNAYDIALNSVNVLIGEQQKRNETYMADVIKVKEPKDATKRQKKEVKNYNKLLKEQRKTELPPVDEPLYLNCELLFALAEKLDIPSDEKEKIDKILHQDNKSLFVAKTLDDKFWFNKYDKKIDINDVDISFDGKKITIPASCITDRFSIAVSIDGESETFNDWKVDKVKRKGSECEDFIVTLSSMKAKKYEYSVGDKIEIQIYPTKDSEDYYYSIDFKAVKAKKLLVFSDINFERKTE